MRLTALRVFIALVAVLVLVIWLQPRPVPPAPPPGPSAAAPATAPATVPIAPAEPAPVPVPPVAVAPPPAPAEPPAPPPLPPVAEKQVMDHVIHQVPDEGPPPASHQGELQRELQTGLAGTGPGASGGGLVTAPRQFAGRAAVTGAIFLQVDKVPVSLFGIKTPGPGIVCRLDGVDQPCGDAARKLLTRRLGANAQVNCRTPNPHVGLALAFAICLGPDGVDLGGVLIGEGLALADTGQSYDYVGAEAVARSLKRGLWATAK